VCTRPPPVARTVTVASPIAAVALASSRNGVEVAPRRGTLTLVAVSDETPAGSPVTSSVTASEKPFSETTPSELESQPGVKPVTR
jgi:hypothetical protein